MLKALAFASYLETHAKRLYGASSQVERLAAKAILRRIRRGDLKDGFTARDVHQRDWANLTVGPNSTPGASAGKATI